MGLNRLLRLLVSGLLPFLLGALLFASAYAWVEGDYRGDHRGSPLRVHATLLGWTASGDALILSTPAGPLHLRLNGELQPMETVPSDFRDLRNLGSLALETLDGPGWILGWPQPSPDGRWLAVERIPAGAETLDQAELWLTDHEGHPVRLLDASGAHAPRWSPDGHTLAYLRANAVWLLDLDAPLAQPRPLPCSPALPRPVGQDRLLLCFPSSPPSVLVSPHLPISQTPPETIRVAHHPDNTCRDRPAWAVDVLPFEEYVRRVVPAEVPALWPQAVVRAQAIAARTYAWYQVLQARPDFDVTDWTDYQVMCDTTHPASDAAVAATAGQHLAYQGQPILAQYAADHGHPTLDGGLPYLLAVPDPVSLGQPRRGHGHGLSQWGAYRWATRYGWDELQILAHYYPGAEIRHAGERPPVLLGITGPWAGLYYGGHGAWLEANAAPAEVITRVTFWADGQVIGEDNQPADGWGAVLDFAMIGATATLTVSAETNGGLTTTDDLTSTSGTIVGGNSLWLGVDQERPQGTALLLPPVDPPPTITLGLTGTDGGLAGFAGLGISAAWLWEGENFQGAPGSPGRDLGAHNGLAWKARAGQAGVWTSPPVQTLLVGRIYRALFRLRAGTPLSPTIVARLEVVAEPEGRLLGLADVRGLHFLAPDVYQDVPVDFWYDVLAEAGLRFYVRYSGATDLALDRVLVIEYPALQPPQAGWPLPTGARAGNLTVVAFDRAGNASDLQPVGLPFAGMPGPGEWQGAGPASWITDTTRPNAQIMVWARGGFEPAGAACRVSGDEGMTWGEWTPASADAAAGAIVPVTLACQPAYPREGEGLQVQFRAEDVHGRSAESAPFAVRVDTQPPVLSLQATGQPGERGWFLGPVTVTLFVTDTTSGLREAAWRTNEGAWVEPTSPMSIDWPGITTVQARAMDDARLESQKALTVPVDLAPPTAVVLAPDRVAPPFIPVRWQGSDDAAGIVSYDVQVRLVVVRPQDGAAEWTDWLIETTAEESSFEARSQTGYEFRARARDAAGRVGPWSAATHVTVTAWPVFLPLVFR